MSWSVRKTSCGMVYTHTEITQQVIVDYRTGKITWSEIEFSSVKEAKDYAKCKALFNL